MTEPRDTALYLQLDGADPGADLLRSVEAVTVESTLHLPDMLTMVLYDPDLRWVDSPQLALGTALTASFKVGGARSVVFDGEVVELELDLDELANRVTVRAFNRLHRLARGTRSRAFLQVTDSDLAKTIAGETGLRADVTATPTVMPYVLQSGESNLVFLQRRAAAQGFLLYVEGKKLLMKPPADPTSVKQVVLTAGQNLRRFRARASTLDQADDVKLRGWNMKQKAVVVGSATPASRSAPKVGLLAKPWFGTVAVERYDVTVATQAEGDKLAGAELQRRSSRFVEADGSAFGDPRILAGVGVELKGVGTAFGGTYYVTAATHRYSVEDGYSVEFSVSGANPATLLASLLPAAPPSQVAGLVPAIVTNSNDPDQLGRVKVKLPWLGDNVESDWARVLAIGAGPTRGIQWTPEVNDEVLVGFADGNLATPFVLGNLWNGQDKPPLAAGAFLQGGKVVKRALRTRVGHEISFDDADAGGGILIKDKKGNQIEIKAKEDQLVITSKGDIKLSAEKTITMEAKGAITLDTKASFTLKAAQDVKLEAMAAATLKGTSGAIVDGTADIQLKGVNAKLEGSAMTEVKGGILKLN